MTTQQTKLMIDKFYEFYDLALVYCQEHEHCEECEYMRYIKTYLCAILDTNKAIQRIKEKLDG